MRRSRNVILAATCLGAILGLALVAMVREAERPKRYTARLSSPVPAASEPHGLRDVAALESRLRRMQRPLRQRDTPAVAAKRHLDERFKKLHGAGAVPFREYPGEWLATDVHRGDAVAVFWHDELAVCTVRLVNDSDGWRVVRVAGDLLPESIRE